MPAAEERASTEFDTVVVGGGIVGLCISWFLAADGAAVVCLDDGQGGGSIANAGSLHVQMQSRVMQLFPERMPDYELTLPVYPRAVDYWSEIAAELNEDIEFSTSGGLMLAETAEQMELLAEKCERERRTGIDTSLIGRQELLQLAPYLNSDMSGAAYCPKEGKINPLLANAAIRRQAIRHGASVESDAHVKSIERASGGYVVHCDSRSFATGRVVIAAGAGAGAVAAHLGLHLPTRAEPLHMNVSEPVEPFMQHLLQHATCQITMKQLHSGQLLIGGGWPALVGRNDAAPAVVLDSVLGNLSLAQQIVPGINDMRIIRTWAGINPTVDLLSVLGEFAAFPGLFAAIPGDAGYTLGPYCARLLVEEMAGRATDFPLEIFSAGAILSIPAVTAAVLAHPHESLALHFDLRKHRRTFVRIAH